MAADPTATAASEPQQSASDSGLRARYLYDAEFHARVHLYAARTRGQASWPDDRALLDDVRAVVGLEAAGRIWTLDA